MISVELKPHVGVRETRLGVFEIEFDQWMVMVNGRLAGFVGKYPGARVSLVVQNLPKQIVQEIKTKVDELLGGVSPGIAEAAVIPTDDGAN